MPDLDSTRLAALCLVGWSLKTRAEKERGAVNWGWQDGQTTTLTRHQDVSMSCTAGKGGGNGTSVLSCRLLMVVHSFPRLSLRLLSDRLGLIDSPHARSHNAAKHTPGKIAVLGRGTGIPGCLAKEGARADNKYTHRPMGPTKSSRSSNGQPYLVWSWCTADRA